MAKSKGEVGTGTPDHDAHVATITAVLDAEHVADSNYVTPDHASLAERIVGAIERLLGGAEPEEAAVPAEPEAEPVPETEAPTDDKDDTKKGDAK